MRLEISKNAEFIIDRLNENGFEAYVVGGCVRDLIMGRKIDDYDITTSSTPNETKESFSDFSVKETGIKHGTVTLFIDHKPYEITTFRVESGYTDYRHPDGVTFVRDIEKDLARRDFTMNAIAYSHSRNIVDPYNGIEDIKNKIIRAVGDPYKRFSEDALRILRALRFSSTLGFEIEEETANAINELAHTVKAVSCERIFIEIKKLLLGKNCQAVLNQFHSSLSKIIPMNGDYQSVYKCPADEAMRFYCLCGDKTQDALLAVRADNNAKNVCKILSASEVIPENEIELKKYISSLGKANAETVIAYRRAVYDEDAEGKSILLLKSGAPLFISDLAVNGNDLLGIDIAPNNIGKVLSMLLNSVLENNCENTKEALLNKAKSQIY